STNSPPMNRSYRSRSRTISRDSGAGAYSQDGIIDCATWERSMSLTDPSPEAISVHREVVRPLVPPGPFLRDLHQHVVQEARGADPEPVGRHPVSAERLVKDHQVADRVFGLADTAGDLDPDHPARVGVEVARGLHHAQGGRKGRAHAD